MAQQTDAESLPAGGVYRVDGTDPPVFRQVAPPARRYTLKTPYRDGTTHIVLEPLDLMAWLAALVPQPRHEAMTGQDA